MLKAFFTIVLTLLFAITVTAQNLETKSSALNREKKDIVVKMFSPSLSMIGIQNTPGVYDQNNDQCWGNTFVLNGNGEWFTSHLTISMNYVAGLPNPEEGNLITSGTWTMVVYKDDAYFGMLYGDVMEGVINWTRSDKPPLITARNTTTKLQILGGLDGFEKIETPIQIEMTADTHLTGPRAVTVATLNNVN